MTMPSQLSSVLQASRLPRFEQIAHLFEPIEERRRLQRALGLTPEIVQAHLKSHYHRSLKGINTGEAHVGMINHLNQPHLAIALHSRWLGDMLERDVLQVRHLIGESELDRAEALGELITRVRAYSTQSKLMILRSPTSSVRLNQHLTERQMRLIGVEVTGVVKVDEPPPSPEEVIEGLKFHDLESRDLKRAQMIAEMTHAHNHFEYDPDLETTRSRHTFRELVARQFLSDRSRLIGAYQGDELIGFIVANLVDTFLPYGGPRLGNLDFICVDPTSQRRGLGHALNLAALGRLYEEGVKRLTVRTMVCNFPALSILSRIGWRATLAESVYHAHL